jgi:addiction module HigA family antidote
MKIISSTKIIIEVNKMMQIFNPPHPGEIIKELCLEPLGLTVTKTAESLNISRKTLSAIINGRSNISPEMAIRLSIAFDTTAESWLNQQIQYDLWQARQNQQELKVERLVPA